MSNRKISNVFSLFSSVKLPVGGYLLKVERTEKKKASFAQMFFLSEYSMSGYRGGPFLLEFQGGQSGAPFFLGGCH